MAIATGYRWAGIAWTRSEKDRRLSSPVSVSVEACNCVSAMTRSRPIRAPANLASVARSSTRSSSTFAPGSPVAWITPTVRPMMETGTQSAERRPSGRLRSFGQASRSSLSPKTWIWRTTRRRAAVGRVHAAARRLPLGTDGRHAVEVGVAVVRQEQLGRSVGQHGREGPLNDLNDLGLAFGHVERVGQATLEALPLHLGVADVGLAVGVGHGLAQLAVQPLGVGDGIAQFGVELADLLVGAALVFLPHDHQYEGQWKHDAQEDADRHQVGVDARGQRLARHHARDEDQSERTESDDGTDQAEAG